MPLHQPGLPADRPDRRAGRAGLDGVVGAGDGPDEKIKEYLRDAMAEGVLETQPVEPLAHLLAALGVGSAMYVAHADTRRPPVGRWPSSTTGSSPGSASSDGADGTAGPARHRIPEGAMTKGPT